MQTPVFLPKIRSLSGIQDLVGCRCPFSHPKYKTQHVPKIWPVAGTYLLIQNMKPIKYLRPGRSQVPIFSPKIWSPAYTWDSAGCKYLFSNPKYVAWHIPETWLVAGVYFPTQNMKPSFFLEPSQLQIIIFLPKI